MSSAPTSLSSPAASSEAFAQPSSLNHGVSDHLSSSLFQPLQLQQLERGAERFLDKSSRKGDVQTRERQSRKGRGSLNPFAAEFVPVESPVSGRISNSTFEPQFHKAGARNKGPANGNSWRPRGGHGHDKHSVIFKDDLKKSNSDYSNTETTSSGGGLSTALSAGIQGRTNPGAAKGNQSPSMRIPRGQASTSGGRSSGAGITPPGGRKGQSFNANHLLNFQYDPISRPPPRTNPSRRSWKAQAYNKELFLQANFRFLVSDMGDYVLNTSDPDKMLQWEDVAAVSFAAAAPVLCPICLEPPLCAQITTCGHIFCFPCILRYLLMGVLEVRGEHWKKCPLCFAMISSKELRTVSFEEVRQHCVGDELKFTLLTRAKGSIIPFERTEADHGPLAYSKGGRCHLFSKFTLTSDVEPTTTNAIMELSLWTEKVQQEGGEEVDLLPFGFVGIDQLRQRKEAWTEHRAMEFLSSSTPVRQRILAQAKPPTGKTAEIVSAQVPQKSNVVVADSDGVVPSSRSTSPGELKSGEPDLAAETAAAMAELKQKAGWVYENAFSDDEDGRVSARGTGGVNRENLIKRKEKLSINEVEEKKDVCNEEVVGEPAIGDTTVPEDVEKKDQDFKKDAEERDSYTFYQSADGQVLILHPFNVKCLLHHYGSYEALPTSLDAELVELETVTQTELTRKRYRYLSHLPLTAVFQLCEVDLSHLLPDSALLRFAEELRSREGRRRRILQQDKEKRMIEERILAPEFARYSPPTEADFSAVLSPISSVDFEDPRGYSPASMSPPDYEERKLFSRVAKLGFASGYDAPDLMYRRPVGDISSASSPTSAWVSQESGTSDPGMSRGVISFADIIVAQGIQNEQDGLNGTNKTVTKKGKKASKVIMSTAGGRRY